MKGIDPFAFAAGIILTIVGAVLLVVSLFVPFLIVHGAVVLVLGLVILFTLKKQEYVEPIKKRNKKGKD